MFLNKSLLHLDNLDKLFPDSEALFSYHDIVLKAVFLH